MLFINRIINICINIEIKYINLKKYFMYYIINSACKKSYLNIKYVNIRCLYLNYS